MPSGTWKPDALRKACVTLADDGNGMHMCEGCPEIGIPASEAAQNMSRIQYKIGMIHFDRFRITFRLRQVLSGMTIFMVAGRLVNAAAAL
ncbi:MAG: hypothetical protein SWH61_02175 [Thermodesulfobacteriota bacterium]|nr:hypothetical protein [Thermodesulfobacteriota bacterium]